VKVPSPGQGVLRLLLYALIVVGSLGIVGVSALYGGSLSTVGGMRNLWCVIAPASFLDWAIHSSGFGASLLGIFAMLAALRTASRERAAAAILRSATRDARVYPLPHNVMKTVETVGVSGVLDLIDAPTPVAFVHGWFKPRICISTGLVERLTLRELEAVLFHEQWHLQRRDPIRLLAVRTISAAFAIVPPIHTVARHYALATEIAADRHAVEAMGSQRWLASALMKLMNEGRQRAGVAFLGSTEARVAALAGDRSYERGIGDGFITLLLSGATLTTAVFLAGGGLGVLSTLWLHPVC